MVRCWLWSKSRSGSKNFCNGILPLWDRAVISWLGGGLRYSVVVVVTNRPNFDTTTFSLSFNASAVNSVREMAEFVLFQYVWGVTLCTPSRYIFCPSISCCMVYCVETLKHNRQTLSTVWLTTWLNPFLLTLACLWSMHILSLKNVRSGRAVATAATATHIWLTDWTPSSGALNTR